GPTGFVRPQRAVIKGRAEVMSPALRNVSPRDSRAVISVSETRGAAGGSTAEGTATGGGSSTFVGGGGADRGGGAVIITEFASTFAAARVCAAPIPASSAGRSIDTS